MSKRYIESYPSVDEFPLGEPDGTQAWDEENQTMYFMGGGAWQAFSGGESIFNTLTYDYQKESAVLNIPETYTPVAQLVTPERAAGTYVLGLSLTWDFDRTTESVFLRWRQNGGTWNEYSAEPTEVTDSNTAFYEFPAEYVQEAHDIEVEMRKETALGILNLQFIDVFFQRVG